MISDQFAPAHPVPPQRPTDGVSVAALVTGVLGFALVPVVLGALGLHRTGDGQRRGRGLAVAGLVLGILQTLALGALVVLLATGGWATLRDGFQDGWDSAQSSDTSGGISGAEDLARGDCLLEDGDAAGADIEVVDCGQVHVAEVLSLVTADATGDYPGDDAIATEADSACSRALDEALTAADVPGDGLSYGWYTPSADTWADGDRVIDCLVYPEDTDATLTGSLQDGSVAVGGSSSTV